MDSIGGFELGRVYCEDCLTAMAKLPDKAVDLCLTDPPYGVEFDGKQTKFTQDRKSVV